MSMISDLATYLQTNNVGTLNTSLFVGRMPADVDNCVVLIETGGVEADKQLTDIKRPTVQIMVRNTSYETARTKIETIRDLLHGVKDTVILKTGGIDVMNIFAMQEPTHLSTDDNERKIFVCNFVIRYRD